MFTVTRKAFGFSRDHETKNPWFKPIGISPPAKSGPPVPSAHKVERDPLVSVTREAFGFSRNLHEHFCCMTFMEHTHTHIHTHTHYTHTTHTPHTHHTHHGKEGMGRIRGFSFCCRCPQIKIGFQYHFRM